MPVCILNTCVMLNVLIKWNKKLCEKTEEIFGISDYQLLWVAWLKGIIFGAALVYIALMYF